MSPPTMKGFLVIPNLEHHYGGEWLVIENQAKTETYLLISERLRNHVTTLGIAEEVTEVPESLRPLVTQLGGRAI